MPSRTPLFDAAFDRYMDGLVPGPRTCPETGEIFECTAQDLETHRQFRVPPSPRVPWARIRRLRTAIGGYDLFSRSLSDGRTVISMYDPESPVPLVPTAEWMEKRANDAFFAQGRVYEEGRSFFEQWSSFSRAVPRPAIMQDPKNESSEWSSYCMNCKSNYQCYCNVDSENLFYCDYNSGCSHSSDLFGGDRAEWCYQGMRVDTSSHVFWSEWTVDCVSSAFLLNCRNCHDCFGCANLVNKSYCFLNEQLTSDEYRARLASIDLGDAEVVGKWQTRITQEVWNRAYRSAVLNRDVENCVGDDNVQCKDSVGFGLLQTERMHYSWGAMLSKDCLNVASCFQTEWSVLSTDTMNGYGYKMSVACDGCYDVEYSELLTSCEHCFGCIGLYKKQFCVFNTQYSEHEYYAFVDRVKVAMLARGEYGEFFPYTANLLSYNTSHADVMYPLEKDEVTRLGGRWYEIPTNDIPNVRPISELPLRLKDTTDDIVKHGYRCSMSGRPFRIVGPELDLHRELQIALPRVHPTLRRKLLMRKHGQLRFYSGICLLCQASYQTRISPEKNLPVICERCYQEILVGERPALCS